MHRPAQHSGSTIRSYSFLFQFGLSHAESVHDIPYRCDLAGPERGLEGLDASLWHLPSGRFTANAVWLVIGVIAFNLTPTAATITGPAPVGDDRDDPRGTDYHLRAGRVFRTTHHIPPAPRLALGGPRLRRAHHPLQINHPTNHPQRPTPIASGL